MYQYVWFNKKNYKKHEENIKENKLNFVKPDDIEHVRISYWGEHCLECAPPQCYFNCPNWVERYDQKCQKFYYGICNNNDFKEYMFSSEITFRKWGKLETRIYPGVVDLEKAIYFDKLNKNLGSFVLSISKLLKPIIPNCRLNRSLEYRTMLFSQKYNKTNNLETDVFLFQAYSYEKEEYTLFFDIFKENKEVSFREKFIIKPGFNQYIIDLAKYLNISEFDGLAKIYPENDYEANIVILFSDFVSLKNKDKFLTPQINNKPANKVKCVAWDLDNTVWNDILIESDPEKLELKQGVLETIKNLDEKGIIQVIVSKNNEEDVIPVLKRLNIDEYFVYKMINWNAKSQNLKNIAELLNINIDTFAFIDDSVFERNEVKGNLPCVRVFKDTDVSNILLLPEFNVEVTADSKKRRLMYLTEVKRKKIKNEFSGSNIDFLKECNIEIDICNPDSEEVINRCYELVQRTNQLNLSGKKYIKDEFLEKISKERDRSFVVHCKDKFGVYGQVGYFVIDIFDDIVYITEFALSCRVASKYVESAIINWLINKFNAKEVYFKGVNNKKNKLLIDTLKNIGLEDESDSDDEILLGISFGDNIKHFDIVKVNDKIK